jgi:hypothetical protein
MLTLGLLAGIGLTAWEVHKKNWPFAAAWGLATVILAILSTPH